MEKPTFPFAAKPPLLSEIQLIVVTHTQNIFRGLASWMSTVFHTLEFLAGAILHIAPAYQDAS